MRIALLANLDLHSNYGVNLLRDALATHEVALFLSEKVGGDLPVVAELGTLGAIEQALPAEFAALAERGFPLYDPAEYVRFLRGWVPAETATDARAR